MMAIVLIAGFMGVLLIFLLGGVGVGLLVRGSARNGVSRGLHIASGVPLLVPVALFILLQYESPISSAWYNTQYLRACRRRTEVDLPAEPSRTNGIELTSTWDVGNTSTDESVLDLIGNPFLHLEGDGKFAFVESRGRRYSGTRIDYQIEAYDTPTAEYVVHLGRSHEPGAAQFQLSVLERSSQRRMGSITGYLGLGESCPSYPDTKRDLSRVIRPLPERREPAPAPIQRIEARANRRRWEADERIETALRISGPASQCLALEHPKLLKYAGQLIFASERTTRHITPLSQDGRQLYVIDLVCDSGEVIALLRGEPSLHEQPYYLHRYSPDGSLIGRFQLYANDRPTLDSLEPSVSGTVLARNMRIIGNRLTFQVMRLQGTSDSGMPRHQEILYWYEVTLPWSASNHRSYEPIAEPNDSPSPGGGSQRLVTS